jgi:hypothetical protein
MTEYEPVGGSGPEQVPLYEVLSGTFIAPQYIKAGKIIEYNGEPGPHLRPMNTKAAEIMEAYYAAKPEALLVPTDMGPPLIPGTSRTPTAQIMGERQPDEIISFVDMAANAEPGAKPARIMSLAEANATRR